MKSFFLLVILSLLQCSSEIIFSSEVYFRINQVGYSINEPKSAVILSNKNFLNKKFHIVSVNENEEILEGKIAKNYGQYASFKYSYQIDFSRVIKTGRYKIKLEEYISPSFEVGEISYEEMTTALLDFFKVQRCGYTSPYLHKVCHIADATSLIFDGKQTDEKLDLTGGWHDAGDYTKFLNTTAYATYMLIFSYEFDPIKFGFDNDNNGSPDILEEAKIGLDWLLRCNYQNKLLVTQVQDLRDHGVGWRMPENDTLRFDRPAFLGIGKNLIGIYVSALAIGARVWREKFYMDEFADKCLTTAENFYALRTNVHDVDSSGTGAYLDKTFNGKLALAAIEMFKTSNRKSFLEQAKNYANLAGADYWWSYGDISTLAHFRLSEYDKKYTDFIKMSLTHYKNNSKMNVFANGVPFSWGANNTLLGISLQNILYKKITASSEFDTVATEQKDYVLGKNPWGICFVSGFGFRSSKNLHHQVRFFTNKLPGGFAAGPVNKKLFESYAITIYNSNADSQFQDESAVYYDEKNDYLTNEPTIIANATAIFVTGNLSSNN